MPANTAPIFTNVPAVTWGSVTTANTATDGTGTVVTVFTAGTNGSYVTTVIFKPLGTNVASLGRVFINNGSTNATAANNTLIAEINLSASTLSQTASMPLFEVPINRVLPNGYKINITIGTTVAAGFSVTCFGGNY